jgi:transcriptional regulator GlxA family with amidase domain
MLSNGDGSSPCDCAGWEHAPAGATNGPDCHLPVGCVQIEFCNGAAVIDFCGPWEVFQDTTIPDRKERPFRLYSVAKTAKSIRTSGGMQVISDYTFENVPDPKILVIPAQRGQTSAMLDFIRRVTKLRI